MTVNDNLESSVPDLRRRLFDGILANDDITPDAALPERIPFEFSDMDFARCFDLCREVWADGMDRSALYELAVRMAHARAIPEDDKRPLSDVRARYKHLRFAFAVFGALDRYPAAFNILTNAMGHLQDAATNDKPGRIAANARLMQFMTSAPLFALVQRNVDGFRPAGIDAFRAYRIRQTGTLTDYLAMDKVTPHQFHNSRKVISRFRAYFNTLQCLYDDPGIGDTATCLATLNGMMGNYHDELIARKLDGTMNYFRDRIDFPPDIRRRLEEYCRAASNSDGR